MTRLTPEEAFAIIGTKYDHGMAMARIGKLDGCFYKIGRRYIFIREKVELWQEKQLRQPHDENGLRMVR